MQRREGDNWMTFSAARMAKRISTTAASASHSVVVTGGIALATACYGLTGSAAASDYSHECRSSGGQYRIDDGVLTDTTKKAGKPIKFTQGPEHLMVHKQGYCMSRKRRGKLYSFETKTYALPITFRADGKTVDLVVICQFYIDGLPANLNCDRETLMLNYKRPAK